MKNTFIVLLSLAPLCLLSALPDNPDSLVLKTYDTPMHHLHQGRKAMTDSAYMAKFNEVRYFSCDSLFARYAREGQWAVDDELGHFLNDVLIHLPVSERKKEAEHAIQIIRRQRYKPLLIEIDYLEAFILPDSTTDLFNRKVVEMSDVKEKAYGMGNAFVAMRTSHWIFNHLMERKQYSRAFTLAHEIAGRLEELTDEEYPYKKRLYFILGDAYYHFRDYDRAVPLLKMAVADSVEHFNDRSNLRARNTLGVYYRDMGDLDASDAWFRSMLESPDMVKYRPMYDCIAVSNLAGNLNKRGQYAEALPLFKAALPVAVGDKDFTFAAGILGGMGEAYLELGNLSAAKEAIDSIQTYILRYKYLDSRYATLYPLMSRYYAIKGDASRSQEYMDSTLAVNRRREEQFNALYILRAEQEVFETEKQLKNAQLRSQQMVIWVSLIVLGLLAVVLGIIIRLYRRKQKAYRLLVSHSREWAESVRVLPPDSNKTDSEDLIVMETIARLFDEEHIYRDPVLTLESLAQKAGYSRNVVSKAINNTQKKTFNTFINDYRISESIRLMSDPANDHFTTDAIADEAGFNSRTTFYRTFRLQTGVTPSQFRKNRTMSGA